MSTVAENNKRIAKNTVLLYIRMIFLMGVTLYSSRIILKALGVVDFGIYNVVGGVVTMLGFLSSSLGGATSRFITFELGRGSEGDVGKVFRCAVTVHYIMAIIAFVLAETVGLWFVMEKMVIPANRMTAAFWVYQCSVVTFIVSILSVPYNALIIAHERMNAFAYISIFEALAKLAVVVLLLWINSDRLILYAALILVVQVVIRILYSVYCNRHFTESSARWLWNKELSRRIAVYAGWTTNGYLAIVGYTQGINILLNLFFGPMVNAARGVAVQVQSAVSQFFGNFQMAVRPQITKLYAQGDMQYMHTLILNSSRYSFYLILLVALPIFINTEYILQLWLSEVPEHTVAFTRLMILSCMNEAFKGPTIMAIHATGDIKKFQIIEGTLLLTVVPVAYFFLKYAHISSEMVFVVYLIIETITQLVRVWIVYPRVQLAKRKYLTDVLIPAFKVTIPIIAIGFILYRYCATSSFVGLIGNSLLCALSTLLILFFVGLRKHERLMLIEKAKCFIHKCR